LRNSWASYIWWDLSKTPAFHFDGIPNEHWPQPRFEN
jgi:hypothetical protein